MTALADLESLLLAHAVQSTCSSLKRSSRQVLSMDDYKVAITNEQVAESPSLNINGGHAAPLRLLALCRCPGMRIAFLALGLVGLTIIMAGATGWLPLVGNGVQQAEFYAPRSTSNEGSDSIARFDSGDVGEASPLDITQSLLKQAQPEPTPTPRTHEVTAGENLIGIAATYGVKADLIAAVNDLWDPNRLRVGQILIIPPAGHAVLPAGKQGSDELRMWWPLQGEITTYFGEEESYYVGGSHSGIDIATDGGTPVRAVAAGKVVVAWKRSDNVGWHIVLDHGGGISTMYGHLSQFFVDEGDSVERGDVIGAAGDTGFSFGPHLHFEVRRWGTPVDPLKYLP